MFKRIVRLAAVTSLALFAMPSFAVKTFDCSKATATVAQIICKNERLSRLDDNLYSVYSDFANIAENFTDEAKRKRLETFNQDHKEWQSTVLVPCQNAKCAESAYTQRISEFTKINDDSKKAIQSARAGSGASSNKTAEAPSAQKVEARPDFSKLENVTTNDEINCMRLVDAGYPLSVDKNCKEPEKYYRDLMNGKVKSKGLARDAQSIQSSRQAADAEYCRNCLDNLQRCMRSNPNGQDLCRHVSGGCISACNIK